ncbi:MAG: hypothetical protein AAB933_00085 [Patescibacteria group bacterium]
MKERKEYKVNLHLEKIKDEPVYAHLSLERLQSMLTLTVDGIKDLESKADFKVDKHCQEQHAYLTEKERQLLEEIKLKEKK